MPHARKTTENRQRGDGKELAKGDTLDKDAWGKRRRGKAGNHHGDTEGRNQREKEHRRNKGEMDGKASR